MASEGKFTAGPWEARTFLIRGGEGLHDTICHVGTSTSLGPPRSRETLANARLIAAAPELLAALKPFADELDGAFGGLALDHEPITNFDGVNIRVGDLRRAAAAITKATSSAGSPHGE